MRPRGADFSSYQSVEHVAQLAPELAFAFVKLTQGTDYVSLLAAAQTRELVRQHVKVGFYHYLVPGDGARQWDYFEAELRLRAPGPVAVDYEAPGVTDAMARAFIARGRQRGFRVGLYGSSGVAQRYLGQSWTWAAWWSDVPPPFRWDVWQFSNGGGEQDYNVFNGTEQELAIWWTRMSALRRRPPAPLRWWVHDELNRHALGPFRTAMLGPRLAAYALRHPKARLFTVERK